MSIKTPTIKKSDSWHHFPLQISQELLKYARFYSENASIIHENTTSRTKIHRMHLQKRHNSVWPHFDETATLLRTYWLSSLILQTLSFDWTDSILWFHWLFPLILLTLSFAYTELFLWFYWTVEPSTLTRRALGVAITSARHRNAERSATSWTFSSALANSKERFCQSTNALLKIP